MLFLNYDDIWSSQGLLSPPRAEARIADSPLLLHNLGAGVEAEKPFPTLFPSPHFQNNLSTENSYLFSSLSPEEKNFTGFENWTEDSGLEAWDEYGGVNELRYSFGLGLFFCVAYGIVFLIGIVGNSFVVAVVLRSPRMRTPTNFFIMNLALADLIVVIFGLPVTLLANIYSAWILGQWICKIVPYLQGVSVSASIDTLIAIACERFLAICYPMKCQISSRSCRILIIIIWTWSFIVTLPWAIFFQLTPLNPNAPNSELMVCTEKWWDPTVGNVYFVVAHLILCYLLPLTLITIFYTLILRRVSMRKIPQETKDLSTELLVQRSKMKVIKMLLLVCVLFALSWLPLYAIFTRVKFGPPPSDWEDQLIRTITPMAQWLGSSNSCINPILYGLYNKRYRSGFKAVLTSGSCCSKLRVEATKSDSSTSRSSNRMNLSTQVTRNSTFKGSAPLLHSNSRGSNAASKRY
ncbi:neuropeptide SIFamide receptor isoform X1 [Folsomia candida]|uniref:neuropeptide SIFamide receptor isoform X1 n=1 Tax=Folsomia candida TaxID=158441 RepID=UPI0016054519|nr:neuropeptide SIFamide receptor isoform X1 [Folsomia candida]XP_035714726.1 neuropeptide SIFamide receptor isoform X1 [Folsomia candida]